jgi:pimeloyl-[acyl-carrier protein] methyl ester esterase
MIQKMEKEPQTVIKEFLKNAGAKPYVPENIDKKAMIEGLEFLINSDFINQNKIFKNLTFIHGREDIILPLKAIYDLKLLFKGCSFFVVEGFHWINFKEIENIIKVSPGDNPGL